MSNNEEINEQNEELTQEIQEQEESVNGPSSVSLLVDKIKNWLNSQNKMVVFGVGGLLVLAISITCYIYLYKMPREKKGLVAIFKTQTLFDVDSFKQVAKMAPKLADDFSGTKAGNLAAYMAGASFLYTGDYKNAIKYLEEVTFEDKVMSVQAIGLLGDAYIENKDLDKGLSYYEKAAKKSTTEFTAIWWFKKAAKVHEKKKEWQEALDIYNLLKKDYQDAEGLQDIDKYIGRAEAELEGVK